VRANVLGIGIDTMPMQTVVNTLFDAIVGRSGGYVCVTGVHGVMEAQRDASLKAILNRSMLTVPDGVPTVWMGRWQGHRTMERVYGPALMLEICRRSAATGHTHFLYGGGPGVADELARRLIASFPGLHIVGTYAPPFRPLSAAEELDLSDRVAAVSPDFMWVGLSTPKQERFMAAHSGRFASTVMLGVGAAFDMHGGRTIGAPNWMQVSGLEWLFRLVQEPRRLFFRYARNNPAFIGRALLQIAGIRRHVLPRSEGL
jgi:N-acetylglucosaminyldiphosphoundecaprenol N-acetyl-beta-D-mannosaminyltransferase